MQRINRDQFFAKFHTAFGKMSQSQVDGLNFLLDSFENDEKLTDIRHAAYMLATIKRECADTYQPVREYGRGRDKPYGKPDPENKQIYYGRGYVQLTWKGNYVEMGRILGLNLRDNPDLALLPENAYRIMSFGMRNGVFTGVGLSLYINDDKCDYFNARKIINRLDCATMIQDWAFMFESILKGSVQETA